MTETVSSRTWTTLVGGIAFSVGAVLAWTAPAPAWAKWAGAVVGFLGLGLLYRWLFPINSTLTVDERGLRWTLGNVQHGDVVWSEIRRIKKSSDDDSIRLDVGKKFGEFHLPFHFLQTPAAKAGFSDQVRRFRPDLSIEVI